MKYVVSSLAICIWFIVLGVVPEVFATEFSMKCDEKKCTPSSIARFFNEEVLWYPTYSTSNTVTITNQSHDSQFVGHRAFNIQTTSGANIADTLELVIVRKSVNQQVWKSSLQEYYDTSEAVLGVLGSKKTDSFEYTITMKNVGNEYQGKKTQFDLMFGFFMPTVTPTPSPTPTPTNTPIPTPISLNVTDGQVPSSSPTNTEQIGGEVQGATNTRVISSLLHKIETSVSDIFAQILPQSEANTQILSENEPFTIYINKENQITQIQEPNLPPIKKILYGSVIVTGFAPLLYYLFFLKR